MPHGTSGRSIEATRRGPRAGACRRRAVRLGVAAAGAAAALACGCAASLNEYLLMAQKGDEQQVREAIVGIGEELRERQHAGYAFSEGEVQAVAYLKDVAIAHRDPISRMEAISALAGLDDPGAERVFLETIDDDHFGVRWESAKALTRHPVAGSSPVLTQRIVEEPKPEVRIDLIRALIAVGDRQALRTLLEIFLEQASLEHSGRYAYNQLTIYEGIREISGLEHPFEEWAAWKEFYEREFHAETRPEPEPAPPAVPSSSPPEGSGERP